MARATTEKGAGPNFPGRPTPQAKLPDHLIVCRVCDGAGRYHRGSCDGCGEAGLSRKCLEPDCIEFGCSFGKCEVSYLEAATHGYPTNEKLRRENLALAQEE